MKGNIRRQGNSWQVRRQFDGQEYKASFGSRELAELQLRKWEVDHELGKLGAEPPPCADPVETVGRAWFDDIELRLAETTVDSYRCRWGANILPRLGRRQLGTLRSADVDELLERRLREGATPNDVDHDRMMLSSFFTWCVGRELLQVNPARKVKKLRYAPTRDRRALTPDEVTRLAGVLRPASRLALLTAVYTGVRKSELLRMQWADVDLVAGVVRVRSRGREHTKSYEPRIVAIHPTLRAELERAPRIGGYLVTGAGGDAHKRDVRGILEQACSLTGVPLCRWHDLRHTCGTWLRAAGVPLEDIAAILGHSSITSTLIYAHADGQLLAGAVARLPAIATTEDPTADPLPRGRRGPKRAARRPAR